MSPKKQQQIRTRSIEATVQTHRKRLSSTIFAMVRDRIETDDILQEVFAEFIDAYDLGKTIETVGGWLALVARNKVLDRFRREKTQRDHRLIVQGETVENEPPDSGNDWMRERVRDEIIGALERLPAEQREVFVMHELEGKSFEEIASVTGTSVNTLLSRKRYAVLALRKFLKEVYDELE